MDNTNPKASDRAKYIALAQSHSLPVRAFHVTTDRVLANHLNYVRTRENGAFNMYIHRNGLVVNEVTPTGKRRVPDVAFNTYYKYFEQPMQYPFTELSGSTMMLSLISPLDPKEFNPCTLSISYLT